MTATTPTAISATVSKPVTDAGSFADNLMISLPDYAAHKQI
jgi:hypothetical protein